MEQVKPFRVLSLDGGGMRGLYTAVLLQRLVQLFDSKYQNKKNTDDQNYPDIGKSFDMICGTSTGSILAISLAWGIPLYDIIRLYKQDGKNIFPSPLPKSKIPKYFWSVFKHGRTPSANSKKLEELLDGYFGNETIKSLYDKRKIAICIPAVNASSQKAWVFKTPHFSSKHRDDNFRLKDVCLASSAAPIFFPIANINNPDTEVEQFFVDGGLWANNPVLVGLLEAITLAPKEQPVEILSIGTCELPTSDPNLLKSKVGVLDWEFGVGITNMSLSAQAYGYASMAKFLSSYLKTIGKNINVVRLSESQKSTEQLSAIGLDKSDAIAIKTLTNLAVTDADFNHSEVLGNPNNVDNHIIKDIFSNISVLKK